MTLPNGWGMTPLGEAAEIVMGQSPDSKLYSKEEVGLPFLQGCAEFGGSFPEHKLFCRQRKKLAPKGSILFSVRAPVGKLNFADRDYVIGRGLASISGTMVTTQYLNHFLQFEEDQFRVASQGSTFEAINSTELSRWPVLHPMCMNEQEEIAEILSTVDRTIKQTESLIAKQRRIKTGLMQDFLTRGIDEHGILRSEQTHRFKDSPLGRIPVEWDLQPIGRAFIAQLGKMLSKKSKTGNASYPYIGNKNVQWEQIDSTTIEWMDFSHQEKEKFELTPGDILVCEGGEVGRSCIWQGEISNCFYQKAVHRLRPREQYQTKLFPKFMRWVISRGVLSNFTSQTSIAHLTKEKLEALPITIQSKEEQVRMCRVFDCVDTSIVATENQLRKLVLLKTSLMQSLLTGKCSLNSRDSYIGEVNK